MANKPYGVAYNPQIRETEQGSRIYTAWKKVRSKPFCEEWRAFLPFYNWSIENGYKPGARIHLIDKEGEYGPDNCVWSVKEEEETVKEAWIRKWNETVNRIRKHYGMEPLEGTDYVY